MHAAVGYSGSREMVAALARAGADPNAKDAERATPLHRAAKWGLAEVIVALIDAGADPDARDKNEQTPLYHVRHKEEFEKVRALLEGGADPKARDRVGFTPLHAIAETRSVEAVAALAKQVPMSTPVLRALAGLRYRLPGKRSDPRSSRRCLRLARNRNRRTTKH